MNYFSYKLDHDYGLAPNPFGEYCTLAVCKPSIRNNKTLEVGDWIIGTGSKKLRKLHHLIFAMKLEEKISFDQYWVDERFQYKKPIPNGSLVQMYGDNFYHSDPDTGKWKQETSAHSVIDKQAHMENDLSGLNVLVSKKFYYFGNKSPLIPREFWDICNEGRNIKSKSINPNIANSFIKWLEENFNVGIKGDPINWSEYDAEHNQTKLKV